MRSVGPGMQQGRKLLSLQSPQEINHNDCGNHAPGVIYGEIGPSCLLAIASDSAFALKKKKEKNLVGFLV